MLVRLVIGRRSPWDPDDGIAARKREIALTLHATPCVHGVAGAWLRPSMCAECVSVIEASRLAAETRAREALRAAREALFVRLVRDELKKREAVRRSRPPRRGPIDGSA
jgi:hypothetical protein